VKFKEGDIIAYKLSKGQEKWRKEALDKQTAEIFSSIVNIPNFKIVRLMTAEQIERKLSVY
jgi:hypothetical protein